MKTKNHIHVFAASCIIMSLAYFSCSSVKKAAVSCPEFSDSNRPKVAHFHHRKRNPSMLVRRTLSNQDNTAGFKKARYPVSVSESGVTAIKMDHLSNDLFKNTSQNQAEYIEGLTASLDNHYFPPVKMISITPYRKFSDAAGLEAANIIIQPIECDTVVLRVGEDIIGKVMEIGQEEIKYKKCENLSGPVYSIRNSEVFVIRYANGTSEFFSQRSQPYSSAPPPVKKTEGMGLAAFICSLGGLIIAGIPLGILAVVLGASSLGKINRYPDKFMGRGFAIFGIVLGLIDIAVVLIFLASM
jgi:hypothetical protein